MALGKIMKMLKMVLQMPQASLGPVRTLTMLTSKRMRMLRQGRTRRIQRICFDPPDQRSKWTELVRRQHGLTLKEREKYISIQTKI